MKRIVFLLVCGLVIAGCGSSGADTGQSSKPAVIPILFGPDRVMPQGKRVEVKVGQTVELHVTSDRNDQVHVHSTPEHEYTIAAGTRDKVFTFSIDTPGQVAVESHGLNVTILQLVVRP